MIAYLSDYQLQWSALLAFSVLFFCKSWVAPRFGIFPSLLFALVSLSSIWAWAFVENRYITVEPYNQMALRYFACDSLARAFIILVPLMLASSDRFRFRLWGEIGASIFVVGTCLVAFLEAPHGCAGNQCGGLIGNPSIGMSLMVCCLPVFVRSLRQWPMLIIAGVAVYLSSSSIALGLFAVFVASLLASEARFSTLVPAGVALLAILFGGRLAFGSELLNDSDRFRIWGYMMKAWSAPWNIPFGTGLGTYHVFSVNLQNVVGRSPISPGNWWNTLHNDWLQMLFECGALGLVLMVGSYLTALYRLFKEGDREMLTACLLYGIYMALNPALHHALPVLFGAWAFVYALRIPNKEYV